MPDQTCSKCRFALGPIPPSKRNSGEFYCRRYPPHNHHPEWDSCFPLIDSDSWCGDFRRGDPAPIH